MKNGVERLIDALKLFECSEEVAITLEEMEFDCNWDAETFCDKFADDLEDEVSYAAEASK